MGVQGYYNSNWYNLNSKRNIQKMSEPAKQDSKTNGRWTKLQHEKFILGLQLYGKDWKKIQNLVATRNGAQIRSHAQKYFIKLKKDTPNDDCDNQNTSQPEQISPITQNSSASQYENYSYFMSKIVGKLSNDDHFDFWSHLVDHKQNSVTFKQPIRKNSFVSLSSDVADYEGLIPCKKIKSQ